MKTFNVLERKTGRGLINAAVQVEPSGESGQSLPGMA